MSPSAPVSVLRQAPRASMSERQSLHDKSKTSKVQLDWHQRPPGWAVFVQNYVSRLSIERTWENTFSIVFASLKCGRRNHSGKAFATKLFHLALMQLSRSGLLFASMNQLKPTFNSLLSILECRLFDYLSVKYVKYLCPSRDLLVQHQHANECFLWVHHRRICRSGSHSCTATCLA